MSTGNNGAGGDPRSELERSLEHYVRYLTLERGRSVNTISAYSRDLLAYLTYLDSLGISTPGAITSTHVGTYVEGLEGAATTVARKVSSIKNFHRYLQDEKVIAEDVSFGVTPPALPTRLPQALTISEVQALLDSVVGDEPPALRDRALLEFLYATGARISEALALSVDDVLDDSLRAAPSIRVTGKGNKQRIVPVGSFARDALDTYLTRARPALLSSRGRATAMVFLGNRGGALSRQNAWLILQSAAERAGLTRSLSPHTLRHSFATHILAGGADIRVVQELLGHSSVSTTQIYTKVTIDTLREVYQSAHPRAR
ncbi:MAG: site-specific tyrosine recombinase XerD [Actinobacteria bacterium]|nr:site-specific tyrosine recombinase XerD [Actinomycetota bacterium]